MLIRRNLQSKLRSRNHFATYNSVHWDLGLPYSHIIQNQTIKVRSIEEVKLLSTNLTKNLKNLIKFLFYLMILKRKVKKINKFSNTKIIIIYRLIIEINGNFWFLLSTKMPQEHSKVLDLLKYFLNKAYVSINEDKTNKVKITGRFTLIAL